MEYEREGSGPPLIFLPGLGCDTRMWRQVGRTLSDRFTVVHPQTWNQGSIPAASQGLAHLMDELDVEWTGLAGLSMGGYMAFECVRQWPEKIRAVAFLDTTAFADTPDRVSKRRHVLQLLQAGHFEEVLETFVASVLAPTHCGDGPISDLMRAMGRDLGPEVFAADVEAILNRGSYEDVLRLLRIPTLFVAGEEDALTPPELALQMAAEVPGALVEKIEGAGHMTPLENPERVNQVLRSFFEEALSPSTLAGGVP